MRTLVLAASILSASCYPPAPSPGAYGAPAPVPQPAACPAPVSSSVEVHFSPRGGCTESVAAFIRSAGTSVHLQAYGFTSQPVADALCEVAKRPGHTVEVVLDRSNSTDKHSMMQQVQACGAHAWIDAKHQIAHNKITIVDGVSVENGSFNYTQAAETGNAENCLIIRNDPALAAQYEANFQAHKAHSVPQ